MIGGLRGVSAKDKGACKISGSKNTAVKRKQTILFISTISKLNKVTGLSYKHITTDVI